ncbi:hypothetical protein [Halpernia sp.]|uniref:hypothetical protein n=1 Tax=Halpernia sp. TaxID=2782209 RepID=UPI003A8D2504
MKLKLITASILFLFALNPTFAQNTSMLKMGFQERKAEIKKMSPKEKTEALKQFKEDLVLNELQIPENQKDEFVDLYNDYQKKQKSIRNKFNPNRDFENMTDNEANEALNNSFEVGQELLNLRKEYAAKFNQVIKPQKVLKLFHTEGLVRSKMMNHKHP